MHTIDTRLPFKLHERSEQLPDAIRATAWVTGLGVRACGSIDGCFAARWPASAQSRNAELGQQFLKLIHKKITALVVNVQRSEVARCARTPRAVCTWAARACGSL